MIEARLFGLSSHNLKDLASLPLIYPSGYHNVETTAQMIKAICKFRKERNDYRVSVASS